jgi:hypothetical protein
MTEVEWLKSNDPEGMIAALGRKASKRKRRLFGCACCRRIWPLLTDERSRTAVTVAEGFADGLASGRDLVDAETAAKIAERDADWRPNGWRRTAASASACATSKHAADAVKAWRYVSWVVEWKRAADRNVTPEDKDFHRILKEAEDEELAEQTPLLRCIFGNPFRPVLVGPSWLTSTVVAIAEGIYADRAFDRLPILADALEDAGCDHADILAHCRGTGPHARGCWVVDLLLGKE